MKRLIKFALFVGAVAAAAKLIEAKKAEWEGLTESEVRARIDERIPDRVPEDKIESVTERVIEKMRSRGMLADDAATPAEDTPED